MERDLDQSIHNHSTLSGTGPFLLPAFSLILHTNPPVRKSKICSVEAAPLQGSPHPHINPITIPIYVICDA